MAIKYPMIITNTTLGIVLKFAPNPNSIRIESKKVYNQTQTLGGFVFEHWGESPSILTVTGQTAGMATPNGEITAESFLFALKQLYRVDKKRVAGLTGLVKNAVVSKLWSSLKQKIATQSDLLQLSNSSIYYKTDVYNGFFVDFSYEQQGDKPNVYTYQFKYVVTGTAQNFLSDLLFTPSLSDSVTITKAIAGSALISGAGAIANILYDPDNTD